MSSVSRAPLAVPPPPATAGGLGDRVRWVVVALTSLAIAAYVVAVHAQGRLATLARSGSGLSTTYAGRALPIQLAFYCHITFAALALLVGPLQFVVALRRRRPLLHRWIGRVFVVSVGIGSLAAGVMSLFNSAAIDGFFGFGTLAVLWAWTPWRGYTCARTGDCASHQAWMIRCFAMTYAGMTLRAWFGILIGVQLPFAPRPVNVDHVTSTAYAVLPFLSWLANLVVAELLVRRRGLPAFTPRGPATPLGPPRRASTHRLTHVSGADSSNGWPTSSAAPRRPSRGQASARPRGCPSAEWC